ncbi:Dyp-type peroxidase [Micrococcus sp. 2A]|uniref:Dyp-type peroxidase n=1 Tax=Micrococcus sp. 2A TaxID=3142261 RepID=UPI00261D0121|nr:Dyp-type peroxidase [uncultured Micrococcus sp.]
METTDPTRRGLLFGAGALGGGMLGSALGFGAGHAAGAPGSAAPAPGTPSASPSDVMDDTGLEGAEPGSGWAEPGGEAARVAVSSPVGTDTVPFHGPRQAGVDTPAQTHALFLALDLEPGTDRERIGRLLRLLSDDAARLTQGRATLADTEPELAAAPARLTVTFGFGPELVRRVKPAAVPEWLGPLPAFPEIDRLEARFSGGDLLLQICGDDRVSVAHARRMLLKVARPFAGLRWSQEGFRSARGAHPTGTTMRNLFGQVDGTANPAAETPHLDRVVWGVGAEQVGISPWITDGTSLVLRRIDMLMDTWDELDRPAKEKTIGRTLGTGAPLTGEAEGDAPDFAALGPAGFPVIPEDSHLARARMDVPEYGMLRRGYNYDDGPTGAGLLFAAYQADVERQFVPVQRRLAESDRLNIWTRPVGSAVFAIPPGCAEGGFVGDVLFA